MNKGNPKWRDGPREVQCSFCGTVYTTDFIFGAHENCPRRKTHMLWAQYVQVLKSLKAVIENGEAEQHWDSNAIGDKDNACSWGLCTKSPAVYPDPDMHIWPYENETTGRHAPNYGSPGMHCPMRYNWERQAFGKPQWEATSNGCFYDCSFFSPNGRPQLTKQDALTLIGARIELATRWIASGLVEDDKG